MLNYLLVVIAFVVAIYLVFSFIKSMVKAVLLVGVFAVVIVFLKSLREPVEIFGLQVDQFTIHKAQ